MTVGWANMETIDQIFSRTAQPKECDNVTHSHATLASLIDRPGKSFRGARLQLDGITYSLLQVYL